MSYLRQDVKQGLRILGRSRGFAAVAVVTLALGIGANTAIFTVLNSVLLLPLPYSDPEELVELWLTTTKRPASGTTVSMMTFLDWQSEQRVFEHMAAYSNVRYILTDTGEPKHLEGKLVSTNLFAMLGVEPALGRGFLPEEGRPGGNKVVILSHGFWQRALGGDPNAIGRSLRLDGRSHIIVGIMPPTFAFPDVRTQVWVAMIPQEEPYYGPRRRMWGWYFVLARTKPGVSLAQAQAEMNAVTRTIEREYPDKDRAAGVRPLHEQMVRHIRPTMLVLSGAVGLVLLIVCVNLANLLLSRAVMREQEMAIRASLGAGRMRLVRQVLTESLLLALPGGVLGLFLAHWGVELLLGFAPEQLDRLTRLTEIRMDATVLLFAAGASVLTGLAFGSLPALRASRPDLMQVLKQGGGTADGGSRRSTWKLLVVAEIGLALVLLAGAGLMIRSFLQLQRVNLGFDPTNLLKMSTSLPYWKYQDVKEQKQLYEQILERIRVSPGIKSAAVTSTIPLGGGFYPEAVMALGQQPPAQRENWHGTSAVFVSPGYFRSVGIPLFKGRTFNERDRGGAVPVVIVSETLARLHWSDGTPIGQFVVFRSDPVPRRVVGVVGDVLYSSPTRPAEPTLYVPYWQSGGSGMSYVIRTTGDPLSLLPAIKGQVWAVDKDIPIEDIATLEQSFARRLVPHRFYLLVFGVFAALAVTIAMVGIYGVVSYSVSHRTHEFGVRIALGAQRKDILTLVFREGLWLTLIGLAAGLAGSAVLTGFLSSLLFGVTPTDPATLAVVSLLLAAVVLLACYLPAYRATKVDAMTALRYE